MSKTTNFSIKEALKFSLRKTVDNWKIFTLLGAIWSVFQVISAITNYLGRLLIKAKVGQLTGATHFTFPWYITTLIILSIPFSICVYYYIWYQYITIGIALYEDKEVTVNSAFPLNIKTLFRAALASILREIKVALGFILFFIPGFYYLTKYYFAGYTIIDNLATKVNADRLLNQKLSRNIQLRLLLLGFINLCIIGLSILAGLIGVRYLIIFFRLYAAGLTTSYLFLCLVFMGFLLTSTLVIFIPPIIFLIKVHVYKQLVESRIKTP